MLTPPQATLPRRSPAAMLGAFLAALFCIAITSPAAFAAESW